MEEEDDAADLESFLQWATEIGISDSDTSAIGWEENRRRSSCLGYSLIVSHFPDAGGYSILHPFLRFNFFIQYFFFCFFFIDCIVGIFVG